MSKNRNVTVSSTSMASLELSSSLRKSFSLASVCLRSVMSRARITKPLRRPSLSNIGALRDSTTIGLRPSCWVSLSSTTSSCLDCQAFSSLARQASCAVRNAGCNSANSISVFPCQGRFCNWKSCLAASLMTTQRPSPSFKKTASGMASINAANCSLRCSTSSCASSLICWLRIGLKIKL
ncbi:hypothetical protein GALL_428760 [mine drainage metagenome]|uniref:Uncharacterized protein n=1 Tax=mine drainage metagenome TaxID=410659 RepID=A0A1J5PWN7_9ZZZZ